MTLLDAVREIRERRSITYQDTALIALFLAPVAFLAGCVAGIIWSF